MEPVWYFFTRATGTLILVTLVAFVAGLWAGWIKWHTWKREYSDVERDYHKLRDILDVASDALTGEIQQRESILGEYKDANEKFEAEAERLKTILRATKRNYDSLEQIWRFKLATADLRIRDLEAALAQAQAQLQAPSSETVSPPPSLPSEPAVSAHPENPPTSPQSSPEPAPTGKAIIPAFTPRTTKASETANQPESQLPLF